MMNNFISKPFSIALFFLCCFVSSNVLAQCLGTAIPASWVVSPVTGTSLVLNANTTIPFGTTITLNSNTISVNGLRTITVNNGATLQINGSVIDACLGCPTLWTGIVVQPGGTVIMTGSTIKNATRGIDLVNTTGISNCNVTGSNFVDNVTGIRCRFWNGPHPATISGTFFTACCRTIIPTTTFGIDIVGGIGLSNTITLPTISAANNFSCLTTGIRATNSTIISGLSSNAFSNVVNGISASNAATNSFSTIDVVGGNTFNNCSLFGVTLTNNINHNNLNNAYSNMPAGSTCVKSLGASGNLVSIGNNSVSNYVTGFLVQNFTNSGVRIGNNNMTNNPNAVSISCLNNTSSQVQIVNNILANLIGYGTTAINVNGTVAASGPTLIVQNIIHDYVNGIFCQNMSPAPLMQDNNQIFWSTPTIATAHWGIRNANCGNVTSTSNLVQMNITSPFAFTGIYYSTCGIVTTTCNHVFNNTASTTNRTGYDYVKGTGTTFTTCTVTDNEDRGMNFGFRFTASPVVLSQVTFERNRMFNDVAGLRLAGWAFGNQGNGTQASWNRWWACGISRTIATLPIPQFFISTPNFLQEIAAPTGGCPFTVSTMSSTNTAGLPNYPNVCIPPIPFKVVANTGNSIKKLDQIQLIENQTITSNVIIETPKPILADKFYPNPVSQTAYYEVEMPETSEGNIQVLDIQGRLLSQKDLQHGANKVEFDLSEMPNGMYFYKVMVDEKVSKTGKFVVQH
jgi:hypothetical protein